MINPKDITPIWKQSSSCTGAAVLRDKDLLEKAYNEYFTACEESPLLENDFRGKDAIEVTLTKKQLKSIVGFCCFIKIARQTYINVKQEIEQLKDSDIKEEANSAQELLELIARIEDEIYQDQLAGASSGHYNPNIISRVLGLREQSDVNVGSDPSRPLIQKVKKEIEHQTDAEIAAMIAAYEAKKNARNRDL